MSDLEYMEKYGEDESMYLGEDELSEEQFLIDLEEKINVMSKCVKEINELDLNNKEEVLKKLEELQKIVEEI